MALDDKTEHKAEEFGGKVKETVGRATGDEQMTGEGRADQDEANVKQAGDHVKDAGEKIKDIFR